MTQIATFLLSLLVVLFLLKPANSETTITAIVKRQATAWETQDVTSLIGDFAPEATFKAGKFTESFFRIDNRMYLKELRKFKMQQRITFGNFKTPK